MHTIKNRWLYLESITVDEQLCGWGTYPPSYLKLRIGEGGVLKMFVLDFNRDDIFTPLFQNQIEKSSKLSAFKV